MNYLIRFFAKHRGTYSILILLLAVSCSFLGLILDIGKDMHAATEKMEEKNNNTACQMFMSEALSDITFYSYMEENSKEFTVFQSLLLELESNEHFQFITVSDQFLEVIEPEITEIFLYGYEEGCAEDSIEHTADGVLYATKTLQVSPDFFDTYPIHVEEGQLFSKEAYVFKENEPVPILLGSAYRDYFVVGDVIEAVYLLEPFRFEVVGFLDDTSFFYSWNSSEMISCERYIFMPVFQNLPENDFGKRALLQYFTAYIKSDESYDSVLAIIRNILSEYNVEEKEINLVNPLEAGEMMDFSKTYAAMTGAVSGYFTVITGIMIACIGGILSIVLINLIQEENYNLGIYIMCGMSRKQIAGLLLAFNVLVLGMSNLFVLGVLAVCRVSLSSMAIVQMILLLILCISFAVCWIQLKKLDISELIGGKE